MSVGWLLLCRYGEIQQRVLLVTGDGDLLIPSSSEGPRLEKAIPRCILRVGPCCPLLQKLQHMVLTSQSNLLLHCCSIDSAAVLAAGAPVSHHASCLRHLCICRRRCCRAAATRCCRRQESTSLTSCERRDFMSSAVS